MADRQAELRAAIAEAHGELLRAFDTLDPADLAKPTPNEGWTVRDNFAHLATIEGRQRAQIRCAVDGTPYAAGEDVDSFNARMVEERRGWTVQQLRADLQREHAATEAVVGSLGGGDLERTFEHPRRGQMTVEAVLNQVCNHLRTHLADVKAMKN
jgi:uncharacterized protein (TIGR03083 family)